MLNKKIFVWEYLTDIFKIIISVRTLKCTKRTRVCLFSIFVLEALELLSIKRLIVTFTSSIQYNLC